MVISPVRGGRSVTLCSAVPQMGDLHILTEFGQLHVQPKEILVIQVRVIVHDLQVT